ncbi:ABC transporter ATP-binding protein [Bowmanella denitrificans]|uniref:ABC transporter ATP-binding protein n=1 Tax=Bowmanella denitrificans TaxID=366582 RepID=A0ABN0XH70_9ALTE|nr:ABC transporter ATP-binding protein [Bowmanella denitrificans]
MASVIRIRQLCKQYGAGEQQVKALRGVDLDIQQGEFVAVMGPSGSGKSTFMNLIGCLDSPSSGQIILQGEDVSQLSANALATVRNNYLGFVFQQFNLLARTSALENVMLPLLYSMLPDEQHKHRALTCLEQVGLAQRLWHMPSQLSGGQQQRVAIARALVNEPALLLADEPTGALDTQTGLEIMQIFQALNRQGKTLVLVTHEPDIAAFASRILMFRDGQLVSDQQQTPEDASDALLAFKQGAAS